MSGIVISGDTRGGVGGPGGGRGGSGGGQGAKPNAAALKQAVGGVLAKMQEAWNKGDAKGMANLFGEQADYVTQGGGMISGRAKIEEAHKAIFASKSQAAYRVMKMKPLTNDIVIAFLGQQITAKGEGKDAKDTTVRTRPIAVLRRVGNEFKIVAFQVTRAVAGRAGGGGAAGKAEGGAKAAAKEPAKKK